MRSLIVLYIYTSYSIRKVRWFCGAVACRVFWTLISRFLAWSVSYACNRELDTDVVPVNTPPMPKSVYLWRKVCKALANYDTRVVYMSRQCHPNNNNFKFAKMSVSSSRSKSCFDILKDVVLPFTLVTFFTEAHFHVFLFLF